MLKEVALLRQDAEIRFWCDAAFAPQTRKIIGAYDPSIRIDVIASGKIRRYHHLSLLQHIMWPSLMFKNTIDIFKVVGGSVQSFFKLIAWRPDVIFMKGGFVCLPVGIAARVLRIPFVIHDSDAHPGLTNRVLSRWASAIGTGAPLEYYNYPHSIAAYVGVPVSSEYTPKSPEEKVRLKGELGLNAERPLVVITGGGLGSVRLNNLVVDVLPRLQELASVVLISGQGQFDELRAKLPADSSSFQLRAFVDTMPVMLGAADVVVARAGATTILELAALQVPTILIPNEALTGGHQIKNAAVYGEAQAVIVLDEEEVVRKPEQLIDAIEAYITDTETTRAMTARFGAFAKPQAARDMAEMVIGGAGTK